jgi:RimJ/RimL family protein N-acetyltransferase
MSSADIDVFLHQLQDCFFSVVICIPGAGPQVSPIPIGLVSLKGASPPHRHASMSIRICRGEQGKGYGTEAMKWALEWGFMVGGLHRVSIGCFSFNKGAARLYERLGFVVEGRNRETVWKNGGWHDSIEMGMLEGEWRAKYLINGIGSFPLTEDDMEVESGIDG